MRIIYMGTPQFAVPPLEALAKAGHEIAAVVTRTDRPAGRGRVVAEPAVKAASLRLGLTVHQPRRVRDPEFVETLRKAGPDVIIVAAYGQILPKDILSLPKRGCVNIHASLLPKYRGAAPINWAIIRGERETGITIMQMDEGMDTGPVLLQQALPIGPRDTAGSLTEKMSELGARLIVEALPQIASGALTPRQQDHAGATLAPLLKKEEGLIDWSLPAADILNRVRGLHPWPGAYTFLERALIKIIEAEAAPGASEQGVIGGNGRDVLDIGTGSGLVRVTRLQPEGKKPMTAAEFLRGHRGVAGKIFERTK